MVDELAKLLGKPIKDLSPAELAALQSNLSQITSEVKERQDTIKATAQAEVFTEIATLAAKLMKEKLSWGKVPNLVLSPSEDGLSYSVAYKATKVRKTTGTKGAKTEENANGGKITINKIAMAMGGIKTFKLIKTGQEIELLRDVIKALGEDDSYSKGYSASGIVTARHPTEVGLVFNNGAEMTVEAAIAKMKEARATVAAAPAEAPAVEGSEVEQTGDQVIEEPVAQEQTEEQKS